jgi:hypothetical protein
MLKRVHLLFAALATLAAARSAAAEATSYPGGNCSVAHGSRATSAPRWSGEFGNESTTDRLDAYCPVETRGSDPEVTSAAVVLLDRSTTEDVSCRLTSQFVDAGGVVRLFLSGEMRSVGFGAAPQTRSVSVPDLGAIGENMQFQCAVPRQTTTGRSAIFRYQISR